MHIDVLSLFPDYFRGPFDESIIKRARERGLITIEHVNLRDFTIDRHHKVDDRPYGGGPGMVLMPEPVTKAIRSRKKEGSKVVYLAPEGRVLNASISRELAKNSHLILLCGHYEGIDERVIESEVDEIISIGDFVLTNGCLAACVLVDAIVRFIPEVIGHELAAREDSFEDGLLDWPHYTKPREFEGKSVPEVLLSGHHAEIDAWRRKEALNKTKNKRYDLYLAFLAKQKNGEDKKLEELVGE